MRRTVTVSKALENGKYLAKFDSFEDVEGTNVTYLHFTIIGGEYNGRKINVRVDDTDRVTEKGVTYNNFDITCQQLARQLEKDGDVDILELLESITENKPCTIYVTDGKDNYKNYSFVEPKASRVASAIAELKI